MFGKQRFAIFLILGVFALPAAAQTTTGSPKTIAPKPAASSNSQTASIETRVEQYLRNLYAWGPSFTVKVDPGKQSPIPDLMEIPVTVTTTAGSDTAIVYVSKNGNFMIRGELTDMTKDPLADNRSKLVPGTSPSMGPKNAKVTLIEFADFECPSCRALDSILRDFLPKHPELRFVYKNYPLTHIHPWAMTAAIAGQCTYQQNPAAFWKIHDAIFDAQDVITPSNVSDKLTDLGMQLGLNMDKYKACIADPATKKIVEKTIAEGNALNITATPTIFVNARRVVGANQPLLEQYVQFEASPH